MTTKPKRSQFHRHAHPYGGDGIPDHTGADRCQQCGLAETHTIHIMPPNPAAELEARRLGEAQGELEI